MSDLTLSPDGKWMWTGTDWIPAPPSSNPAPQSNINLSDSMMSGDMNVEQQGSGQAASSINLTDSSMSGDINITQNFDAENLVKGLSNELKSTFDPNYRYKVPTTGLSKNTVDIVISKIKLDSKILQNFSLDELYDFCKQLFLMGKLNNLEYCIPYLIQRAEESGDVSMICMSKILVSQFYGFRWEFSKSEAYARSAMEIASNNILIAERMKAIYVLSDIFTTQSKDTSDGVSAAEDLIKLEGAKSDALVYAHLLVADSKFGPESESHEIQAFKLAEEIGDLEMMATAVIYAIENETHTLENDIVNSIVNKLELAGYDLLVSFVELLMLAKESSVGRGQMKMNKLLQISKEEKIWEIYVPLLLGHRLANLESLFDSDTFPFDFDAPDYSFLDNTFLDDDLELAMNIAVESNAFQCAGSYIPILLNISLFFFYPLPKHVDRFVSSFTFKDNGYRIIQLIHNSIKGLDRRECAEVYQEINNLIQLAKSEDEWDILGEEGSFANCITLYEKNWIEAHQDAWRFDGINRLKNINY